MNLALIILPVAVYLLLVFIYAKNNDYYSFLSALIKAYLSLYLFITISTELLSINSAITFRNILLLWLFLLVVGSIIVLYKKRRRQSAIIPDFRKLLKLNITAKLTISVIILILIATLATGIIYPPNNWDSMTYHMARVVNWIYNSSVAFYPTAIDRQNYSAPLAEFAIMHLQILTGSDLYANTIQWLSFLIVIVLGILVSAELGLSKKQQLFTAIIIATLPMAILQASSTQNDLVVSGFIFSFAFYMLRLKDRLSIENIAFASISLGLAFLTKGTAYMFCAAIGLVLGAVVLYKNNISNKHLFKTAIILFLIVFFALLVNTGNYSRNYDLYQHPLSKGALIVSNSEYSLPALFSNIIRNGAIHLATPFKIANNYIYDSIKTVLGPQLNNPKTTFSGTSFIIRFDYHEDVAGNLLHMLIIIIGAVSLPLLWSKGLYRNTIWYSISIIIGVILYSLLLSWQPWASRLHTPFFILSAPLIAIVLSFNKSGLIRIAGSLIIVALVLYSMLFVFSNASRPLLVKFSRSPVHGQIVVLKPDWLYKERTELYFYNRYYLYNDYKKVTHIIIENNQQSAGLYLGGDCWEYPFWVLANFTNNDKKITFYHVGLSDKSGNIISDQSLPALIIATKNMQDSSILKKYNNIYVGNHLSLWRIND